MVELVKMRRGECGADVHPDEVENYCAGGWVEDTEQEPDEEPKRFDVYRVIDGLRSSRASKVDMTLDDATTWVEEHPKNDYELVEAN